MRGPRSGQPRPLHNVLESTWESHPAMQAYSLAGRARTRSLAVLVVLATCALIVVQLSRPTNKLRSDAVSSGSRATGNESVQREKASPLGTQRGRVGAKPPAITAAALDAVSPAPRRHQVHITVVESLARRVVPHANIELHFTEEGTSSPVSHVGQADATGQFTTEFPPGDLRISAWSDDGIASSMLRLTLEGRILHRIEIALDACAPVTGHVSDSRTGAPIEGVRVSAPTVSRLEWAETNQFGDYLFLRFPVARGHRLTFEKPGYARALRVLNIDTNHAWTVLAAPGSDGEVRGSATPAIVRVALNRELRIEGRVVDSQDRPIAGAELSVEGYFHLMPEAATPDRGVATSDSQGAFEVTQLRPDISHSLLVRASGYAETLVELPAPASSPQSVGTIRLDSAGSLGGTVADASGRLLEDIAVRLSSVDVEQANLEAAANEVDGEGVPLSPDAGLRIQGRHREARTSPTGAFEFSGLGPGRYELQVRGEAKSSITKRTIELLRGEDRTGVALNLPGSCVTLFGRVLRGGASVPGVRVRLERQGWTADVRTHSDGEFWVGGLDETGPYDVYVYHLDHATGTEWEARASQWATAFCELELEPITE